MGPEKLSLADVRIGAGHGLDAPEGLLAQHPPRARPREGPRARGTYEKHPP